MATATVSKRTPYSARRATIIVLAGAAILFAAVLWVTTYPKDGHDPYRQPSLERFPETLIIDRFELSVYWDRLSWMDAGTLPYRDVKQEYPPLAVAYFALPKLFVSSQSAYAYALLIQNAIVYALLIGVVAKILRIIGASSKILFLFALPSAVYFTLNRFDVFVSLLVMLAVLCVLRRNFGLSMLVLALAILVKWYPVLFVPFFVIYAYRNQIAAIQIKKGIIVLLSITFGITLLSVVIFGINALFPYAFHMARGFGIGSIAGSVATVVRAVTGNAFGVIGSVFMMGLFAVELFPALYATANWKRVSGWIGEPKQFVRALLLITLVFILAGKFYSPQWELWWLPLAACVFATRKNWMLIASVDILNYLAFPVIYRSMGPYTVLYDGSTIMLGALLIVLLIRVNAERVQSNNQQEEPYATVR